MRFLRATSVLLALLTGAACAGGMEDVNRVQPNYYDKSLFTGTWYMRQTVVDVPYEVFWLAEGTQNDMAKIRWEIQEKFLFAYNISPTIPGVNSDPTDAPSYHPVAAWPIISHFDIIREYNPSTGEQSNVIVENSSDRPWYERQYIRVDWSSSRTISEYTFDTGLTRVRLSGANHWIQPHEETDPDAAEVGRDYISIVNAFDAYISWWDCSFYFGDLSYHFYLDGLNPNCGPATVRVRSSFAKVDPEEVASYEPLLYLDKRPILAPADVNGDGKLDQDDVVDKTLTICADVNELGQCTEVTTVPCTEQAIEALNRDNFHRRFGFSMAACDDEETFDYLNKFPYFRTTKIRYTREYGQVEASREYFINRHRLWERALDENGKPIPYEDRKVRPIVYYLNADYPEYLYDAAEEIERQWNEAFAHTVATLQGKSIEEVGKVFEVRKNSCSPENLEQYVSRNDKARKIANRVIGGMKNLGPDNIKRLCAALEHNLGFKWQKIGDVRYNFINYALNPTSRRLLGYGPSSADPDTGEIISSGANVYGGTVDRSAAMATDVVLLLLGRMSEAELQRGEQFLEAVRRAKRIQQENRELRPSDTFFEEFDRRMAAYRNKPLERTTGTVSPGHIDGKLERLKALGVDKQFMDEGILTLLRPSFAPGEEPTSYEEALEKASFFDLISPQKIELRRQAEIAKGLHGCMLEEGMVDDAIIGLALDFDGRNMSRDQIFNELREKIYIGVMLHEIGHTLGLRHNFEGSMDAINYFDEFWEYAQLSEDPTAAQSEVTDPEVADKLSTCVSRAQQLGIPRPTTMDCLRASELKVSTVMEYGKKFNSDFRGLGKYDKAAIAFGYGLLTEVFANEDVVRDMIRDKRISPSTASFVTHYRRLPEVYGGSAQNFLEREWIRYDEYQRQRAREMVDRVQALPQIITDRDGNYSCVANCGGSLDLEVPYKNCIDEYAGRSLACHRFDEGGSFEEVIESNINDYESYYFLNAFRRGRTGWTAGGYLGRLQDNLIRGTRMFQYYYYYNHRWQDLFDRIELDLVRDLQVASVKAFNHMARILQTPAEGRHCLTEEGTYKYYETWESEPDCVLDGEGNPVETFNVPLGIGRPQWQIYNDDYPHYQIESLGTYYERIQAIFALTLNQSLFLQEAGDPRTFVIGFNKAFEDEVIKLLGSVAVGDLSAYSGRLVRDSGRIDFRPRPIIDLETFGSLPVEPEPGDTLSAPFSYEGREIALLLGMIFMNDTRDAMTEFRDYFTVVQKGSNEDFDLPAWVDPSDEEHYMEFTNPYSGTTYRTFANPRNPGLSFGMHALREAKEFHDEEWKPAFDAFDAAKKALEGNPNDQDLLEAYLEADAELREKNFDMNEKIELIDRIRYWYTVTKLGM